MHKFEETIVALAPIEDKQELITAVDKIVFDTLGISMQHETMEVSNLVYTWDATPGMEDKPSIVLQAHHDIWSHGFSIQREGGLFQSFETGALDDRSGMVAILTACEMFKELDLPHPKIVILFTDKEETGFVGSRLLLEEHRLFGNRMPNFLNNVGIFLSVDGPVDWDGTLKNTWGRQDSPLIAGKREVSTEVELILTCAARGYMVWSETDGAGDHIIFRTVLGDKVVNIRAPYSGSGSEYHTSSELTQVEYWAIPITNWIKEILRIASKELGND